MTPVILDLFEMDLRRVIDASDDIKQTQKWEIKCAHSRKLMEALSPEQAMLFHQYCASEEEIETEIMKRLYTVAFKRGFHFALDFLEKPINGNKK